MISALIIASLFVYRGPRRALSSSSDLRGPYSASVAWMKGVNPYDSKELTRIHVEQGGDGRLVQLLHPPGLLPVLAPLAVFHWKTAKLLWMIVNLIAVGVIIRSLLSITPRTEKQRAILILGTLAFAPLHTAIQLGQLSLISIALGLAAFARLGHKHSFPTAVLIALSATFKPQIGLVFLIYLLTTKRFKVFSIALSTCLVILGVGLGGIFSSDIPLTDIQSEWQRNLSESNSARGGEKFTEANPARSNLINLHILLFSLISDQDVVSVGVPIIVLTGCLIWFGLYHWGPRPAPLAITLSIPLLLSLLVVYHRTYDVIILLLPLSWAITEWRGDHSSIARLVLITGSIFTIPGGAIIAWAQTNDRIPADLLNHSAWKMLIVPHASIALLVISIALLIKMARPTPIAGS